MKDDPTKKDYWFSPKKYGYGWSIPVTWQGWVTMGLYALVMAALVIWFVGLAEERAEELVWLYLLLVGAVTMVLVLVVRAHGPPAKWRWGNKDDSKK